jgi:hypothetical protein
MDNSQQKEIRAYLQGKHEELESQHIIYTCSEDAKNKVASGNTAEAIRVLQAGMNHPKIKDAMLLRQLRDEIFARTSDDLLQKVQDERAKGSDEGKILAVTALVDLQTLEGVVGQPTETRRSTEGLNRLRADLGSVAEAVIRTAMDFDPSTLSLEQAINQASDISSRLQTFDNVIPLFTAELEPIREKLKKRRTDISTALKNLQELDKILQQTRNQMLWDSAVRTGDFQSLEQYQASIRKLELNTLPEVRAYDRRLDETKEVHAHLLQIISEVKQKFSRDEDFATVKKMIVEGSVQSSYRTDDQAWQAVHVHEYDDIRRLLDDRMRVPDVYGNSDLVGWEKVLEQAEERAQELELWQAWDKQCEYKMDTAEKAFTLAESHREDPIRIRKSNWEKVRETAQVIIEALAYLEEIQSEAGGDARSVLIVGVRDVRDIPVPARSRRTKEILAEGKRRRGVADDWLHKSETQISVLNDLLERRSFPTPREFADAVAQKDWDRLEKLLVRAREAGITDDDERRRVEVHARLLEQQRTVTSTWWKRKK